MPAHCRGIPPPAAVPASPSGRRSPPATVRLARRRCERPAPWRRRHDLGSPPAPRRLRERRTRPRWPTALLALPRGPVSEPRRPCCSPRRGFVARLPMAMVSLGIVLLVSDRSVVVLRAGVVSAAVRAGQRPPSSVVQARLDRPVGAATECWCPGAGFSYALALDVLDWTAVELESAARGAGSFAAAASGAVRPTDQLVGQRARWAHVLEGQGAAAHRLHLRVDGRRGDLHRRTGAGHGALYRQSTPLAGLTPGPSPPPRPSASPILIGTAPDTEPPASRHVAGRQSAHAGMMWRQPGSRS